jgi:hypothetical protein
MSTLYTRISAEMDDLYDRITILAQRDGYEPALLTGKLHLDVEARRVWFEVLDDTTGTTSWVTMDAPEHAAQGEGVVAAVSLDEALMLPS